MKALFVTQKKSFSLISIAIVFVFLAVLKIYCLNNEQLTYDIFGYYLYLPATFYYHDPGLQHAETLQHVLTAYHPTSYLYQAIPGKEGFMVMKYTMGWAILNLPFFILAHIVALLFHFPCDGFSTPYQYLISLGGLLYTFIGLYLFRKILLEFFSDKITATAIIAIGLGTNYFQLNSSYGLLPHSYLFMLYTLVIWNTIRWHQQQHVRYLLTIAVTISLIILTRPVDVSVILLRLFWGILAKKDFKKKLILLKTNHLSIILAVFLSISIISIQLIYWKFTTGKFLYFTYTDPREGFFDFAHPFFGKVLFSMRKGWFVYTPLAVLMILGFISMFRRKFSSSLAVLLYFAIHLYLVSSWSYWWYAGTLSQRSFVQSYAILGLPFCFLLAEPIFRLKSMKMILTSILFLLICINLFQTWQYELGLIDCQRMTGKAYQSNFLRLSPHKDYAGSLLPDLGLYPNEVLYSHPEGYTKKMLYLESFEKPTTNFPSVLSEEQKFEGHKSLQLDSINCYGAEFILPAGKITKKNYAIIKISIEVYSDENFVDNPLLILGSFQYKEKRYNTCSVSTSKQMIPFSTGKWNHLELVFGTPAVFTHSIGLHVFCWYQGKKKVFLDHMKVEVYEPVQ